MNENNNGSYLSYGKGPGRGAAELKIKNDRGILYEHSSGGGQ